MQRTQILLLAAFSNYAAPPAIGGPHQMNGAGPRPITEFSIANREVELLAVSQRGRADTPLRKDYLYECKSLGKAFPGYPQPAFMSVDFRVKF